MVGMGRLQFFFGSYLTVPRYLLPPFPRDLESLKELELDAKGIVHPSKDLIVLGFFTIWNCWCIPKCVVCAFNFRAPLEKKPTAPPQVAQDLRPPTHLFFEHILWHDQHKKTTSSCKFSEKHIQLTMEIAHHKSYVFQFPQFSKTTRSNGWLGGKKQQHSMGERQDSMGV